MNKEKINVALILYTQGLEYDDRIRKEMLSIRRLKPEINFTIYAVVPQNEKKDGITGYGVPFHILHLKSRDRLKSGKGTLIKAWDFYRSIKSELKNYDYIWCADIETFLFPLFCSRPILWDLHELPTPFMSNSIMRFIFKYICRKTRVVLHANEDRINYLDNIKLIENRGKHLSLRNYPSFDESVSINDDDDEISNFAKWLGIRECVYLQGISDSSRADYESVSAVMNFPDLCGVVVGRFNDDTKQRLTQEYGDELNKRIYFTGMVPQLMTPAYIKRCCLGLVFYKNTSPNNFYCEANRFYQNICNGNPVIVGCNPPMKSLVDKYKLGVVLESDGSNTKEITAAIKTILNNYDIYKSNVVAQKDLFCWESQSEVLETAVNKLIDNFNK